MLRITILIGFSLILFAPYSANSQTIPEQGEAFRQLPVKITGTLKPIPIPGYIGARLVETDTIVKASEARNKYGFTGSGYAVAIIDSGADYNHPALGSGFGSGKRVIAGYDFVNNDNNPMDDNGHGTHAAGIAAGNDSTYKGIAPDANIVALKVLDANGDGNFGDVADALRWVIDNRSNYNIVAVNMSIGTGNFSILPSFELETIFSTLVNAGVTICVAAGNDFFTYSSVEGLSYPAISPRVISVGAIWDANAGAVEWESGSKDFSTAAQRVTSFTQRSSLLSIMAPGAILKAAYLNGTFENLGGTSMSAPVVAGAALLMHQALKESGRSDLANQSSILNYFKNSGTTVIDGDDENDNVVNTGRSFKSLNLLAAMDAASAVFNTTPVATGTPTVAPTATSSNPSNGIPPVEVIPTPVPTAIPTITTPEEVSSLLTSMQEKILKIKGRLNGSDDLILNSLSQLRDVLRFSLDSLTLDENSLSRLRKINTDSAKLIKMAKKIVTVKEKQKELKIKIKTGKKELIKLTASALKAIAPQ